MFYTLSEIEDIANNNLHNFNRQKFIFNFFVIYEAIL